MAKSSEGRPMMQDQDLQLTCHSIERNVDLTVSLHARVLDASNVQPTDVADGRDEAERIERFEKSWPHGYGADPV